MFQFTLNFYLGINTVAICLQALLRTFFPFLFVFFSGFLCFSGFLPSFPLHFEIQIIGVEKLPVWSFFGLTGALVVCLLVSVRRLCNSSANFELTAYLLGK